MLRLLLQPLDPASRPAETARMADALERGADRTDGLSYARALGSGEASLVECGGTRATPLLGVLLAVVRSGRWAAVLAVGADEAGAGDGGVPRASTSPKAADRAALFHRAARSTGRVALLAPVGAEVEAAMAEASLQLLGVLERRRSEQQQQAGRLVESGASQREAAAAVGVSQQAVHDRLRNGLWHETRSLAAAVAAMLEQLAAGPSPGDRSTPAT